MKKILKITFYSFVFTLAAISFCRTIMACQVDEFFLTKPGYLASSSPERLQEANRYVQAGNKSKLDDLIKSKLVLMLKDGVKVQALEWSVEEKMIKIKFEGSKDFYWVNDGALKQIKAIDTCEKK